MGTRGHEFMDTAMDRPVYGPLWSVATRVGFHDTAQTPVHGQRA